MNCIVTAGPAYESLDQVRRLTNFSTGKLGSNLAAYLSSLGHQVTLLRGLAATYSNHPAGVHLLQFSTGADLGDHLRAVSNTRPNCVFHAAAVSDFRFGKVFRKGADGALIQVAGGKFSTQDGPLLAELLPTHKIISDLRAWFPDAWLVGWKYEVDGSQSDAVRAARQQIERCRTDCCIVNGPAYGNGFGCVVRGEELTHVTDPDALFALLSVARTPNQG